EMNNTDTLEKIIRHQKNKDPAYPFREHLLMQLCIRTNKRMQDNISEFLGVYGINHSAYMVLTTLFAAENHCLSPSEISQKLQFTRTKEGANKQVISSQADSLIKISRIWADF
ncbi:hypothetical protein NQ257_25445, partial [Escherichia coli]|nr:hypothetical protein [Escherichia coli]